MKMTNKKIADEAGCAKWLLAGTALGAVAIGSCSYAAGVGTGYIIWSINEGNEMACVVELTPKREEFKRNCIGKTYDTVDRKTLDRIVSERDQILQQNDCVEQVWKALPEEPDNYASPCKVEFEYK